MNKILTTDMNAKQMYTKEILKCENNTLERKKGFLQSFKTLTLKIFQLPQSCRINLFHFSFKESFHHFQSLSIPEMNWSSAK